MVTMDDFNPAASKRWSVEFNNQSMQTRLTVTSINGQSMELGHDATAEPGWTPPTHG